MRATLSPQATLTLEEANTIATAARTEARRLDLAPICVAVLDAAGTTKAIQTEDRVALMRPQIATAKAWGSLGLGFSTRTFTAMADGMSALFQTFSGLADNRIVPSPGGVLIARDGVLVGSIGVSGDTGPNDELCGVAGVEASGLVAQL
ncbi:MAG TPA: heme-binding protein [Myxococcales bacterium]|nr:heme-binding protein [Myxococcales bacterium]HIL80039.1 heme-binding protein [Myxococcales bacterium]